MKLLILAFVASFMVISFNSVVLAQGPLDKACEGASNSPVCQDRNTNEDPLSGPSGILGRVTLFIAYIVGIVSVIMVIIGGIKMIVSSGDAGKFKSGRDTVIFALVGLVIAILAPAIILFILDRIG